MSPPLNKVSKGDRELAKVRAALALKMTNLNAFCEENDLDRSNVIKAFKGKWTGKRASEVKQFVITASKAKPTQPQPQPHE